MAPSPAESDDRRGEAPMEKQNPTARRIGTPPSTEPGGSAKSQAAGGSDDVVPIREAVRPWALEALVAAYGGGTHPLLAALGRLPPTRGSLLHPPPPPAPPGRPPSARGRGGGAPPLP